MDLLVFGDAHIKPVEESIDWDQLTVPTEIDVVVSVGDVIHDARENALEYGHAFFRQLSGHDRPIVTVPGNHDPNEFYPELLEDIPNAVNAHKSTVELTDIGDTAVGDYTVIGWGCEQFAQQPEISPFEFPALTPDGSRDERRFEADQIAQQLEDELYRYVNGETTETELLAALDIADENHGKFSRQIEHTVETFEEISSLLDAAAGERIVLSHVPPYNTAADRHHSIGEKEMGVAGGHVGSIGLKLALRMQQPLVSLHGHSHNPVYEPGFGGKMRPHSLNPGFQGIVHISLDQDGGFSYHRVTDGDEK